MINRNHNPRRRGVTALALVFPAALLITGCESEPRAKSEFFPKHERAPHVFAAAHAEAGARNDATLGAHHFWGVELNSLGEDKLDLLTAGRADRPITLYMNMASGETMTARCKSVTDYLHEQGIEESAVHFVTGPNPANTSPAASHLSRMSRTEGQATPSNVDSSSYLPAPMTDSGGAPR